MNPKKNKLVWNAVPTLFSVPNPPAKIEPKRRKIIRSPAIPTTKSSCDPRSTTTIETPSCSTPKTTPTTPTKYKRQIKQLRSKIWRMNKSKTSKENASRKIETLMNELRQYLPEETVSFIQTQVKVSKKTGHQIRWPLKDKMLALSLYYHSKKAYKLLSKMFKLPSKSTLQRTLQRSNVYPGFSEKVFSALKIKVNTLSEIDRNCAIVFDEMTLKVGLTYNSQLDKIEGFEDFGDMGPTKFVANHALAFMVRGLHSKWKQPVGYFLSSGPVAAPMLQNLVRNCIKKIHSIGLKVKVLICDQGTNNRSFLEKRECISIEKPFFEVDDQKIFCMYDPPHLLKNIRNNLMKQGFVSGDKRIQWCFIESFYEFDKQVGIRMAPKITENHIRLKPFASMRVNLATQILSHSVAAGISTYTAWGKLDAEAKFTAEFIDMFDKLFNCFNSNSVKSSQQFGHALNDSSGHHIFLNNCYEYLCDLKIEGSKRRLPCVEGWKLNIKSVQMLWENLKSEGFKFLLTNRLNQDCAENLFSIVRGRGGNRDNPNPEQFRAAFRQIIVEKLLVQSDSSNCRADVDRVLLDLASMSKGNVQNIVIRNEPASVLSTETMNLFDVMRLPNDVPLQNVAAYMAGYLLRKIKIECTTCVQKFVLSSIPEGDDMYVFLKEKAYKEQNTLVYPSKEFASVIEQIEKQYVLLFPNIMHSSKIMYRLVNAVRSSHDGIITCDDAECHSKIDLAVKLYLKVRLHASLRRANIRSTASGGKRNRKVLKLLNI